MAEDGEPHLPGSPRGFDTMPPFSSPRDMPLVLPVARRSSSVVGVIAGLIGAGLLVGGLALWATYGTAVFFETIASGLEACF
jgi:hypothetical protein